MTVIAWWQLNKRQPNKPIDSLRPALRCCYAVNRALGSRQQPSVRFLLVLVAFGLNSSQWPVFIFNFYDWHTTLAAGFGPPDFSFYFICCFFFTRHSRFSQKCWPPAAFEMRFQNNNKKKKTNCLGFIQHPLRRLLWAFGWSWSCKWECLGQRVRQSGSTSIAFTFLAYFYCQPNVRPNCGSSVT